MAVCKMCLNNTTCMLMDFGLQPVTNRYLSVSNACEFQYPFILGYCEVCGLLQLIEPMPYDELRSRFSWIYYTEPEGHLDHLVEEIIQLPGIIKDSVFCGISGHEKSTCDRLNRQGYTNSWQLNPNDDLECSVSHLGVETVQQLLTSQATKKTVERKGKSTVVIARSLLEHSHNPLILMEALQQLIEPGGYIVFEVPDSTRQLEVGDYSMLWEEHVFYFTPYTLQKSLEKGGFHVCSFKVYQTPMMDSMIAIVQKNVRNKSSYSVKEDKRQIKLESKRAFEFATMFPNRKKQIQDTLRQYRQKGEIALLGAGHLACSFINLMGLGDFIQVILDDHSYKKDMYMPGSRLKICPTDMLEHKDSNIHLCLLSVSHESESKIIDQKKKFATRGGKFSSIFPMSDHALISYQLLS